MKIRLSLAHIASFGLILFVLLQVALTVQALSLSRQAADTVETISGPLTSRLKKIAEIDRSLTEAHHIFLVDQNKERISVDDVFSPLALFEEKIRQILKKTSEAQQRKTLENCLAVSSILRQGALSVTELGNEPADYHESILDQIENHVASLRSTLLGLAPVFSKNSSDSRLLPLHLAGEYIVRFNTTLQSYLDMETLDITVLIHILTQAESDLQVLRHAVSQEDQATAQKIKVLESQVTLLRTNLPTFYFSHDIDPNISLAQDGLDALSATWDQMILSLGDLRSFQEDKILQARQQLHAMTLEKRVQFFTLACASIIACLLMAFLLRKIFINRIAELAAGTHKIAGGDFNYRLKGTSSDHLGSLSASFNKMAETLAAKEAELQNNLERLRFSKMQLGLSHIELEERVLARTADLSAANDQLQLMGEVFEHSLEGIIILDSEARVIKVNPSFTTLTQYEEDEALGQNVRFLESDEPDLLPYAEIKQTLVEEGSWDGEVWIQRRDKEIIAVWLSLSTMRDDEGRSTGFIAIFHDISELKQQADLIQHQALHDPLTELPNRILLKDRMDVAISHAMRSREKLAVVFLDLDNFKTINDSLGHDYGDLLLREVASRLTNLVRPGDTVCRMGGDEFVVLVDNLAAKDGVRVVAKRIKDELTTAFQIKGRNLFIGASIGISFFPDDGADSDSLIKHADLAMYQAKSKGKNNIQLFTAGMNEAALERLALEEEIRAALESDDQFGIYLQPKVELATMEVTGLEALARWHSPKRGMVSPLTFIPICEEAGLIVPLGTRIMEIACRQAVKLAAMRPDKPPHVAVNISIKQLQHKNFITEVQQVMDKTGIQPSSLEFEITESVLMSDPERTLKVLHVLADMGINIAIDDFGTGYSSLFYLKHFPVSTLKIDKSFIDDITTDASSDQIVETIIAMAQRLQLTVVAEGVENKAQLEHLEKLQCDTIQGYYFSKPLPPEEVEDFLMSFKG